MDNTDTTSDSSFYNDDSEDRTIDDYYNNKWLLILPRVTACISLLAVSCVAMEAWKDLRRNGDRTTRTTTAKNVSTITHIQLFYQIPLFCHAVAFAMGTTTAPQGQAWGAIGNTTSCSLQGFLLQLGVYGALGWDAALSTAYILMVRYKVAEVQLQSYKKYFHLVIWPICLAVSIYPLTQQMYNLNGTVCWVESYPNNCQGDECLRGEGAVPWQNVASLLVMIHLIYSISAMICLYCAIRGLENHTSDAVSRDFSVNSSSSVTPSRRYSKAIAVQGMLYASGMIMTSLPTPIYIVLWNTAGLWNDAFAIFATSMLGLVGYVNFVIFMRKRSVDQCHTRYAKFLRRAHGWLFDSNCKALCQASCLTSKGDIEQATATPTPTRISAPRPRRSLSVGLDEQSQRQRAQIKHDLFEEEWQEREACPERTGGPLSGFFLKVKDRGQRLSQWVSELGASNLDSSSSVDDSWSDTHDDDVCDASRDNAPSRPRRLKSHVEDCSQSSKIPPCKPMRCRSEFEANTEVESLSRSARTAPPTIPVRFISEVESEIERPPAIPERYVSEVEQSVPTEEPPTQPVRYVSEIDLSESDGSRRQRLGPPAQPQRYESEMETDGSYSLDNSSGRMTCSDNDNSSFVRRQSAPPTRPLRVLSEVDDSRNNGSSGLLPLDAIAEHSSDSTVHVVSELNDDSNSSDSSVRRNSSNQASTDNDHTQTLDASNPGEDEGVQSVISC